MRILLSAYSCEPGRGSEPGVGWSWATELAKLGHHVTALTRTANRPAIEQQAQRPPTNLTFLYYDLPAWIQRRRSWPGGKAIYYVLWQWFAARHVRHIFATIPFDLVHHVTYVSARYPSFMGTLGIPFWSGPVSGGEAAPLRLRAGFSAGQRCRELLRDVSNWLVRVDPLMRRTYRQAERIFVTRDSVRLVPQSCHDKTEIRLAIGLSAADIAVAQRGRRSGQELRLLYVGRLLEWKGIDIALHAMALVRHVLPGMSLTIVGEGPARARLQRLIRRLGLQDIVRWTGWQPRRALAQYYRESDLLVFPSLRDSGGMVVLESLAHGLPVLCTDLGGPGAIVNATCGRVIKTKERDREQLAHAIAHTLLDLATLPDLLESLSHGARARARQFRFGDLVLSLYPNMREEKAVRQA